MKSSIINPKMTAGRSIVFGLFGGLLIGIAIAMYLKGGGDASILLFVIGLLPIGTSLCGLAIPLGRIYKNKWYVVTVQMLPVMTLASAIISMEFVRCNDGKPWSIVALVVSVLLSIFLCNQALRPAADKAKRVADIAA